MLDAANLLDTRGSFNLMRGPRPNTFQDFLTVGGVGARTVINLETGFADLFKSRAFEEDQWASAAGVSLIHLPISDIWCPTLVQIKQFLMFVDRALNYGNVYFHCLYGKDRTGIMAASYRIAVQKWSVTRAKSEMMDKGFHEIPYCFWVPILQGVFDDVF